MTTPPGEPEQGPETPPTGLPEPPAGEPPAEPPPGEPPAPPPAAPSGLSAELSAQVAADLQDELSVDEMAADAQAAAVAAAPARPRPGRLARLQARASRALQTKRGLFLVFVLVAGIGSVFTVGGVAAIQWTETADFCGRCHAMGPELKAYEMSPHREVACAECHVEPGIGGWVKAKINGTKQLFQVITGTFPKPIPAPDHADLPPVSSSCEKCHDVDALLAQGGPIRFVLQNRYSKDEPNTKTSVALVFRPVGFGGVGPIQGVHWHIGQEVEYFSSDPRAQTIDLVRVDESNGESATFIASDKITVSQDVQPDVDHLAQTEESRLMDCIVCHNRTGHGIPGVDQSIDDGIDSGKISQSLPYIKNEASDRLSVAYASVEDADAAIDGIRDFYGQEYPLVAKTEAPRIDTAIDTLKTIYRLVATPDMQVTAATYPNNIGHQTAPGCFRCHDGAHYKVVDGAVTSETIPSTCATCHTYPQIGNQESGVVIGERPESHSDSLWLFSHKTEVTSTDPTKETCGACHTRTYCENCHNTPVAKVTHDNMMVNHAQVARDVGAATCAACHPPVYCAQCHANDVLPGESPEAPGPSPQAPSPSPAGDQTGSVTPSSILRWPLLIGGRP